MGDEAEYLEGQVDLYKIYQGISEPIKATSVEIWIQRGRICVRFNGIPLRKYKVKLGRSDIHYHDGVWISYKVVDRKVFKDLLAYFSKQNIDVIV